MSLVNLYISGPGSYMTFVI